MKKINFIGVLCVILALMGASSAGAAILSNAPDYAFWYGASPTSAGMIMGYYDINGYNGLRYDNLVPGGTAELSTFPQTNAWDALVKNVIASQGHVNDFYIGPYAASGDDRITPPPYHNFNSLADFMGTSQDSVGNSNGTTTFYFWTDGAKFTAQDAFNYGVWNNDGMYGMLEYLKYTGYDAAQIYTELIKKPGMANGFTFDDYMAEIDAGRAVMIQVEGHSMFGYGYDAQNNLIYLHDTWGLGQHQMTWGGAYSGMNQWGVVVMELTGGTPSTVPEPTTMLLLGSGLIGLAAYGRKKFFKK